MFRLLSLGTCLAIAASTANAQDVDSAIKARKAHMSLYGYHLGVLGAMAKGETEYNAEIASAVAGDLAKLASTRQATYWPPGSDNSVAKNTRLLPAAWEKIDDVIAKAQDLSKAATAMAETAGDGIEALQAGVGQVGPACGACHKPYRAPE